MNNYKEDLKKKEERIGGLVNLITDYAIEHGMSAKEIDECVDIAKEVFYSDATVKRTAPEVSVQEQSSSKLKAKFTIKGLDTLINSTDSFLNIDSICTNKTSVEVNLFES